ncbi:MAG: efflux RND transporter periplasmic adaptor subunit [Aliivibrio sp.]|uniref:efflux RND transporter periplasmic adaptor subunit n=1 Tax=Aliivibrio sp. TaxID=1872443 RepID=UPI001A47C058|nr:efflux RND transporter periplasmic adaptor subunit [Aliivibrio sp.]
MKTVNITLLALLVGGALGYAGSQLIQHQAMNNRDITSVPNSTTANGPLYWVAPMDPNYQRDKPGKSPMGMDLIPVYAEDTANNNDKMGTVTINPAVENNLGVKSEQAKMEKLSPRIETVGYVEFDKSRLWQTNVRVAGWVEKLNINAVGEYVKKGDVLFKFYSPELVKAQEELLNAYQSGRRGLVNGATERLVSLGVDRIQIKQIVKSGKASQSIEVKALANGVIAKLNIQEGSYLSPAQSIISAGPIDEVWVDAEVFERQSELVIAGSNATMTLDAISGKTWQGKVDYVYPILDPTTRTLRVRLKFPNPEKELKPNMFANITLQPKIDESVLTIPRSSVIRSGGMNRVVLAEGKGRYRSVRIDVGREAGDRIEVIKGLSKGDRVVTSAHFMLDSESSQSADLSRINGVEPLADNAKETVSTTAWAKGKIIPLKANNSVIAGDVWMTGEVSMLMADFGMITLSHQPVIEWDWSAGEMNFSVDNEIELSGFEEGQLVRFLVTKEGVDFRLKQLNKAGDTQ